MMLSFLQGAWPSGIEARCVINSVVADFEDGLGPADPEGKY